MNLPWLLLALVLAFAGGGVLGELDGARRTDQRWTAKVEKARADAVSAARGREIGSFRNMEVAYRANQMENQKLRAAAARADHAARGLRDDLAALRQWIAGSDSGTACTAALGTCHAVLGDCGERYAAVAQAADEHAADAKLCLDAWPGGRQ